MLINTSEWEKMRAYQDKYKKVEDVEKFIKANYYQDTSDINFIESQITGLFTKLDPYSEFLNEQMFKDLLENSSGEFVGIGIQITTDEMGYTKVQTPIADTPAEHAGILSGDFDF